MTQIFVGRSTSPDVAQQYPAGRTAVAAAVCSVLEWFDFWIATAAARMLFSQSSGAYSALLVFPPIVARLLGAALFGAYGDRVGRKAALIMSVMLMSVGSLLLGAMLQIPVQDFTLLVMIRCMQGVAIGGAWAGCVCLPLESAEASDEGYMAAWPQIGMPAGFLLALLVVNFLSPWLGWSCLVAGAVGLLTAKHVWDTAREPPSAIAAKHDAGRSPVLAAIRENHLEILLVAMVRLVELAAFLLFTALIFSPGLVRWADVPSANVAVWFACLVAIVFIPVFGRSADRDGKARVYLIGSMLAGGWAFVYVFLLGTGVPALMFTAVIGSGLVYAVLAGPQAALIAKSFPISHRYSGASLGTQLGSAVALAGIVPLIQIVLAGQHSPYFVAALVLCCASLSTLGTIALGKEELFEIFFQHIIRNDRFDTSRWKRLILVTVFRAQTEEVFKQLGQRQLESLSPWSAILPGPPPTKGFPPPTASAEEGLPRTTVSAEEAASSDTFGPKRSLNAWIDDLAPVVARPFEIRINIGAPTPGTAASAAFYEPDWRGVDEIDLIVMLSGANCEVDPAWQELTLKRTGDTDLLKFKVRASAAGSHEFTIRVYLAQQMIRMQSLSFAVSVAEMEAVS